LCRHRSKARCRDRCRTLAGGAEQAHKSVEGALRYLGLRLDKRLTGLVTDVEMHPAIQPGLIHGPRLARQHPRLATNHRPYFDAFCFRRQMMMNRTMIAPIAAMIRIVVVSMSSLLG
jgi:hypothetical protein